MTYEEALTSEFKSTQLSKQFPEAYVEPLERKLHGLQADIEDAIAVIRNFLNTHYFPGEIVYASPTVLTKAEAGDAKEIELEVVAFHDSTNTVHLMRPKSHGGGSSGASSSSSSSFGKKLGGSDERLENVPIAKILRKASQDLTPELLLNKMLCVASHGHYKDAPWVLHDAVLAKLANPPKLSASAAQAMSLKAPKEKKRVKRKRDDVESGGSGGGGGASGGDEKERKSPAKERKSPAPAPSSLLSTPITSTTTSTTSTTSTTHAKGEEEPKSKKKKVTEVGGATPVGGDAKAKSSSAASVSSSSNKTGVDEAPKSKYPMEDLAIERTYIEPPPSPPAHHHAALQPSSASTASGNGASGAAGDSNASSMEVDGEPAVVIPKKALLPPNVDPKRLAMPIRPSSDFMVPQHCMNDLLMLCSFLSAFHETLTLSPFPAEDLVAALHHPEYSSLLGEVHHRLLRHLNAHNNNLPKMTARVWEPNLIYYLKAKLPLLGHVSLFAKLKRDGYFALSFEQKLQLLVFIAHMVSNNRIIERPASDYPEKKARVERNALEAQGKLKRQYKTQKANGIEKGGEDYLSASDLKAKLAAEEEKYEKERSKLSSIRIKPLGQDRYHNTYWWFGKNALRATANPGTAASISVLEASVLVEYHDGNIDYASAPAGSLDEYASDEEERQESITYLNAALPGIASVTLDLMDEEAFSDDDASGEPRSHRHEEPEYDANGRPIRRAKLNAMRERDDDEEEYEDDEEPEQRKGSTCEICLLSKDMHKMLLCDGCDKAHHMYCLQPPLHKIPDGDWYCPVCLGGALPPPPTVMPATISTRAGQQRLLEMQLAAVKREEEAARRREEEAQKQKEKEERHARIVAEKAQRVAALKVIEERAIAQLKAEQEAQAVTAASSSTSSSNSTTVPTASTTSEVDEHRVSSSSSPTTNAMQVDSSASTVNDAASPATSSTAGASSSMHVDGSSHPTDTSSAQKEQHLPQHEVTGDSAELGAAAEDTISSAILHGVSSSRSSRPTYNHLKPAPMRERDLTNFMKNRVTVRWGYYETPEELKLLMAWLDDRGVRERHLKQTLAKKMPMITELMEKRFEQLATQHTELPEASGRRHTRHSHAERKAALEPFQTYVNKAAENAR